jgi:hypothetical protein
MTAITFNATPRAIVAALKLRELSGALREAIDEFVAYRIQHAVPEQELRRAEREIARYRGLMQTQPNLRS